MRNPPLEKLPEKLQFEVVINGNACLLMTIVIEEELSDEKSALLFEKVGQDIARMFKQDGFVGTVKQCLADKIPLHHS